MAGLTDFGERKLIDALFASTVYLALFTATPSDTGGGTEVTGGAYARRSMAMTAAATVSGVSSSSNSADVVFPTPTASWGTVTHFAVFDAISSGNMLFYAALSSSRVISTGTIATAPTGNIVYTMD